MKNNTITIGRWSAAAILINTLGTRVFLNYPRNMIEIAGTAGWMVTIYASILALLLFTIISRLFRKFEGKDLLDISEQAIGGAGRIITGVIILAQLLFAGSLILREFAENMKVIALVLSPISFVSMFFLVGMVIAAYAGIEAIARFHAILVPIISITYLFILIGVLPFFDTANFFPILGTGADKVFGQGFFGLSIFAPIVILFLLPPFIKAHKNFKMAGYLSLGLSAFFFLCAAVVYIGVYPYPTSMDYFLPIYQLSRMINFGRFFQRVESLFFLAWAVTALMYLSIILYFSAYVFKKTFRLEYQKPLIIPFAAIIFTASFLPPSLMAAIRLETKAYPLAAWAASFGLALIVLFIANVINKRRKGGEAGNE